jgi:soluble lytic murein transglycosylase-like protein
MTWIAALIMAVTSAANGLVDSAQLQQAERGEQVSLDPPVVAVAPPPVPTYSGPCAEWAGLLHYFNPGWNVSHFQQIMYRESRCDPNARNPSGATGLLQLMPMWVKHLGHCGVYSTADLMQPDKNVCGAAHIFRTQGINAWSQTK